MDKNFEKNKLYYSNDSPLLFIGLIDGINIFKLEYDKKLYFFYHIGKKTPDSINSFNKKDVEIFTEEQIPVDIQKKDDVIINYDESEFLRFVFTAKPKFPNSAFCPENMLDVLFEKKGIIYDESNKIELSDKFRAINPDYCLINGNDMYRQTDMRENYPDLILKFAKSDKNFFINSAVFNDEEEVYLTSKSSEIFGGKHNEFSGWIKKTEGDFNIFFKDFIMASFRRVFSIKKEKIHFLKKLNLSESKVTLLKKSI